MKKVFLFFKIFKLPVLLVFISSSFVFAGNIPVNQEPLFEGLGNHTRKITASSPEAQKYFDQGLAFLFAFNHDEAIRSFQVAAELDNQCAMAQWGIAIANGPHINNPFVDEEHGKAAWKALNKARELDKHANAVEKSLIEALSERYVEIQPEDRKPLDEAYAAAMRKVWKANPEDADIGALFAESLMDLRPWDLWTHDGQPQPGTEEILAVLETVLSKSPDHMLALHLYIHAMEASPFPERADDEADRLRDLAPGLGHLTHMPSHIDVRRGRWSEAIKANEKAIESDKKYLQISPVQKFYNIYISHNYHMLAFSAMMQGQSELSINAIDEMVSLLPPDLLKEKAPLADGILAMPIEFRMRFGKWDEVLSYPEPAESFPIFRALRHFARGVAFAVQKKFDEARLEQRALADAREAMASNVYFGNNSAGMLLETAGHMLSGEILFLSGKRDEGITELREAVKLEDNLRYDEPPDWVEPVRQALGAALLRMGRAAEAEEVYREDLKRLPMNGWSLFGLAKSLRMQKKDGEAAQMEVQFRAVWQDADIELESSCFCQRE